MVRYLVLFNYFGPSYLGVQGLNRSPAKTVSMVFKDAMITANRIIDPSLSNEKVKMSLASRTDRFVHSMCNASHIDFESPVFENLNPNEFTYQMNLALKNSEEQVSVLKSIKVPSTFSARHHALSRTYIYKFGISNGKYLGSTDVSNLNSLETLPNYPLFDRSRCMFLRHDMNLDMDLLREAAKVMSGKRDFRAFTTPTVRRDIEMEEETEWGVKSIKNMEIKIYPSDHLADPNISEFYKNSYQMWNVMFKSSSFIYKQIRRMMAAMLGVGFREISLADLEKLFDEKSNFSLYPSDSSSQPSQQSPILTPDSLTSPSEPPVTKPPQKELPPLVQPPQYSFSVFPYGLYLANIEYPEKIMNGTATELNDW